jgi:hypothetical protein
MHRNARIFPSGRTLDFGALGCTAVLASALAAVGPAATGGAAAAGQTAPKCTTSGLVVWIDTQGNGAAGSVYYKLKFTNLSGHACTLFGYPGVSAVDLRGRPLGKSAGRDASPKHLIRLGKGTTANALLRIVEVRNFPAARCHRVSAAGLRVYPPNQTGARLVPFPFQACSRRGPVYLSVRPVSR